MSPQPDTGTLFEAPAAEIPQPVVDAPPRQTRRRKLSSKQMASLADVQLRKNSQEVLESFWETVKAKLRRGDSKTMEMVSRMYQYDRGPGGVTIFNQHLQVNGGGGDVTARVRSFDQIVGKLEEQQNLARQARLAGVPGVIENAESDEETDDESIIDAETVDDGDTGLE